jgi:hypothetical protein
MSENQKLKLSPASHEVFMLYANDADNWSGLPWVSVGNVDLTGQQRGNLADLVKKDLVLIQDMDGQTYVRFTSSGKQYAEAQGVSTRYWS